MTERGKFIVFEGGEGAGKTTQVLKLVERLKQHNIPAINTREPGGTMEAEAIRNMLVNGLPDRWLPKSELLLFFAARVDHVERLIKPKLAEGIWVISDRYIGSSIAYQGYGRELGPDIIEGLCSLMMDLYPDIEFILDLPVDVGLARAKKRAEKLSAFERLPLEFHERMREGYKAGSYAKHSFMIDAQRSQASIESIIFEKITELYPEAIKADV